MVPTQRRGAPGLPLRARYAVGMFKPSIQVFLGVAALFLCACAAPSQRSPATDRAISSPLPPPQARSLIDGHQLRWPAIPPELRAKYEAQLAEAQAAFDANPNAEVKIIWLGRRLAYLGRIIEAIEVYTAGLQTHPRSPRILRHRGHRYITVRNFDAAYDDLLLAAQLLQEDVIIDELEADGQPNAQNQPTSTLHGNIYYHLALAAYLKGDFAQAASLWGGALNTLPMSDDMRVAFMYWRFNALVRLGNMVSARDEIAELSPDLPIIENFAYKNLLLHARGLRSEAQIMEGVEPRSIDEATLCYGLAVQALGAGDLARTRALLTRSIATGQWPSFGATAAEADLASMNRGEFDAPVPISSDDITKEQIRDITRQRNAN